MQYEQDSDLQDQQDDYEVEAENQVDELDDAEAEESEGEGEQGARQEKAKSNFVDFDKIPDEDLRHQVKSRVGELYRKSLEADQAKTKLQKLQEELDAIKAEKELVVVEEPSVDLAIDNPTKFAQQQKAYSEYLVKKHQQEQMQQAKAAQVKEASERAQQERIAAYNKRVKDLKIEPELLTSAANQIASAGISNDLANYLLEHDYGPALVKHLGTNFEDLHAISQMSPMKAVAYIESQIAPKAMQRKTPSAPPPPTKVKGARNPENSPVKGWKVS
jgi:hypothetical protein